MKTTKIIFYVKDITCVDINKKKLIESDYKAKARTARQRWEQQHKWTGPTHPCSRIRSWTPDAGQNV